MEEEIRGRGIKLHNDYAAALGRLFAECPKSVFAAIAVSALTCGGEQLQDAQYQVWNEWRILHENGIVEQKPPAKPECAPAA